MRNLKGQTPAGIGCGLRSRGQGVVPRSVVCYPEKDTPPRPRVSTGARPTGMVWATSRLVFGGMGQSLDLGETSQVGASSRTILWACGKTCQAYRAKAFSMARRSAHFACCVALRHESVVPTRKPYPPGAGVRPYS